MTLKFTANEHAAHGQLEASLPFCFMFVFDFEHGVIFFQEDQFYM